MLVYEYVNLLVASELKPLGLANIGGDFRDEIQEKNLQDIIGLLNLANSALHEKFALLQKEFLLEDIENNKTFALPDDFVYPINAALEDGTQVPLNNERKVLVDKTDKALSLMFPEPFVCLVKGEDINSQVIVSLVYIASPKKVTKPTDKISITSAFTQAILDYVAYKAFLGVDGHVDKTNNTYYMRYIADCKAIETSGLAVIDNLNSNVKLLERGFV
jgi:hypothetical protein